ncbi:tRNA lysidine(34) synthetase TilS [Pseudomonas syringae pv. actinidiae]|nr:tRNA lysidine(34) synthetase TilS [Pseudomonas syringae pv. actinidiae]
MIRTLNILTPSRPVTIALSGGVDSIVLADLAVKWGKDNGQVIHAVHVNHGLSERADEWSTFVEKFCEDRHIQLHVVNVVLDRKNGESLEDIARKARHRALIDYSPASSQIVFGHHLDDQLETMLIALKRGSGALRMAGMQKISEREDSKTFVRPLIETEKSDILAYAESEDLAWVEDESNEDSAFDRNFLRNEIIPLLKNRWPGILSSTARSSRILRDEAKLLEDHAKTLLRESCKGGELRISNLNEMTDEQRKLVIRYWIMEMGIVSPREDKVAMIYKEVAMARPERTPQLRVDGGVVKRRKGHLYFTKSEN